MDSSWLTVGNGDPTPRLIKSWECVEEVSFKGVIVLSSEVLAGLPAPARTLRYHVASLLNYELDETRFFVQATIAQRSYSLEARAETVVFVVASEEERVVAEEVISQNAGARAAKARYVAEVDA